MARLDSFDVTAYPPTWNDVTQNFMGWMDRDFVPPPAAPPPPPPPVPTNVVLQAGGAAGGAGVWVPEREPCVVVPVPEEPAPLVPETGEPVVEEEEFAVVCPAEDEARDADYVVLPVGEEAQIRALEAGATEHKETPEGEKIILLHADSGTVYLYGNVSYYTRPSGRVAAGEVIGVTGAGPYRQAVSPEAARAMLGAGPEVPVSFTGPAVGTPAVGTSREVAGLPPASGVSWPAPLPVAPDLRHLLEGLDAPPAGVPWGKILFGGAAVALAVLAIVVVTRREPDPNPAPPRRKMRRRGKLRR
jgi:hypothetical protein